MAECPRCESRHKRRKFTPTGYVFTCPSGHKWVREEENEIDPGTVLETFHQEDPKWGDILHVNRVNEDYGAHVHARDEDGNFAVVIPDHLTVTVTGGLRTEPTIRVESRDWPVELTIRDPEDSFTSVYAGPEVGIGDWTRYTEDDDG